jgi:folylpolyglutamate synthase/dihydropteroate synthase
LKGFSEYQLENSGLAMEALNILREKGLKLSDEAILKGFENTKWPGISLYAFFSQHKCERV